MASASAPPIKFDDPTHPDPPTYTSGPASPAMALRDFLGALAREQTAYLLLGAVLVSLAAVAAQRLWLSPIAHVPGPRLAALTQLYELYYDVVLGGQYALRIAELHERYGPVVRINPWEVHVQAGHCPGLLRSSCKSPFFTQQFGTPHTTINHDHHTLRRMATDPVSTVEPMIEDKANRLVRAFAKHAALGDGRPLNVMYPFSAYANDLINEYAFSRCDDLIERSDFGAQVTDGMLAGAFTGSPKHAGLTLPMVKSLPGSAPARWATGWAGITKMKKDLINNTNKADAEKLPFDNFDLPISQALPAAKNPPAGPVQDQLLAQGGALAVSWALSLATFHLVHRPSALATLRDELLNAVPDADAAAPLATLEALPYLRAVVRESLRFAVGTTSRLARVPADATWAAEWTAGAGTVVSTSPYMASMDDSVFPDPTAFRPERWLEEGAAGLGRHAVVFGQCPGRALAHAELYFVLAKLFRRWGAAGDRRAGDVGVLRLFETAAPDCLNPTGNGPRFVLEAF
jgi:hypothetical protein